MCACFLLAIAVTSLPLEAIYFFHIYVHCFLFVSETKCMSNMCTNVESIDTLHNSAFEHKCAM